MRSLRAGWMCVMGAALASGAGAARLPVLIVDQGLHREWAIERDRAHPERPPRLVEVPWTGAAALPHRGAQEQSTLMVRTGMRVTLRWRDQKTNLRLEGIALEAARVGETVSVRAGLHGAVLRGVVRGPGLVELEVGRR